MSQLPIVALVPTGGTIGARGRDRLDLAFYGELDQQHAMEELLEVIPEVRAVARVRPVPFRSAASHALQVEDVLRLARRVVQLVADPSVDGVVVTHGTNTLEETAFVLALVLSTDKPVVLTGSMRPASGLSSDSPINLFNAIRLAAAPGASGRGVLVLMDDTVHSARDVTKASTARLDAFRGAELGPLGFIEPDGSVLFHHRREPWPAEGAFSVSGLAALPRVDVVMSYLGADASLIDASVRAGAAGIVSAGTGAGFPTPAEQAALEAAADGGVVVVQASRTGSGRVGVSPAVMARGIVSAGNLAPVKARLLLMLVLTRTHDPRRVAEYFGCA
ncbi:asparaginase [Blastococcus sp. BMG 814]|uniref:asparaginase n=1 Tax=Blastococcus carthaginiensis TaxID=3050034 RepID=A0ABT9IA99_9ACTN|nr:asparaginase [Blastococcus carthaginiensis]MDP5182496.1 asparaginase [Blastococcus carthaginiensis]